MNLTLNRRWMTAALAGAALSVSAIAYASGVQTNGEAKDFTLVDSNGVEHTLSDYTDGTVVLEWTNHDCPYVRKHYGTDNMQDTQKTATADGVTWFTIISSAEGKQGYVTGDEANELTTSRGAAPTAVLLDPSGDVGRMYNAQTTPHMFVIEDGVVVYQGAIDDNPSYRPDTVEGANNYVLAALDAIAAGETPAVQDSKPYGCSVKY